MRQGIETIIGSHGCRIQVIVPVVDILILDGQHGGYAEFFL